MKTDIELVQRLRAALIPMGDLITEKKMFGGYCFLYKGKMCVGEIKGKLMVRVLQEKMTHLLKNEHVFPMDFTGKPMKEFIYVSPKGIENNEILQEYIELGIEHAHYKANS